MTNMIKTVATMATMLATIIYLYTYRYSYSIGMGFSQGLVGMLRTECVMTTKAPTYAAVSLPVQ